MIDWNISREDHALIVKIVKRAIAMALDLGENPPDTQTLVMDLTACHGNGCPLKLEELLAAGDSDFAHDVFEIGRHVNRKTGKLDHGFMPRYARPVKAAH